MKLDKLRKKMMLQGIDGVLDSAKEINTQIDKFKRDIHSLLSDAEATRRVVESLTISDGGSDGH